MRRSAREVGALIVGSAVSGLSAYAAVSLGTRNYGSAVFAPVSVLWTFWALSTAMLAFPLQHWIIRQMHIDGHDGGVRASLRRICIGVVVGAIGMGAIAFTWRHSFFGEHSVLWPALVLIIALGSSLIGAVRGILAARERFYALASAVALENLLRLVAAALVVIGSGGIALFGVTLVAGPLVALGWPSVFRLRSTGSQPHRVLGFLAGVGGGTLASQMVLTFGPAALALIGGQPASVTGLFVTLALFRAPYIIALGVAPRLTGPLAEMVGRDMRERLRQWVVGGIAATVVGAGVAAPLANAFGADLIELVFGSNVAPNPTAIVGVAAGAMLALGALLLTLVLIAAKATRVILLAWALAGLVALGVLVGASGEPLGRVVTAFLAAESVAFVVMAARAVKQVTGPGSGDHVGSDAP